MILLVAGFVNGTQFAPFQRSPDFFNSIGGERTLARLWKPMAEPQDMGELKEGLGASLLRVLEARVGQPTLVCMASGVHHIVYDGSAWGRDLGELWEHVTAFIGPDRRDGAEFFRLSDVECLIDPDTRMVLIAQTPAPEES